MDKKKNMYLWLAVHLVTVVVLTLVTPASATFPGKNGRIAFGQTTGPNVGDIFIMNPDGSDVKQLTFFGSTGGIAALGEWSPDGSELVFSAYASASAPGQIWIMSADGSNQHLLLSDPAYSDNFPTFSPDGSQIVFSRCPINVAFFQCAIYRVNADGSKLRAITPINSNHDIIDFEPAYSQDGSTIAFESFWRGGLIEAIYVMNADGSGIHSLTPPRLGAHEANWSPDRANIVFASNDIACQCGAFVLSGEIWLIGADGHKITRLTFNNDQWDGLNTVPHDFAPSWSPQGDAIVFERDSADFSQSAIYVMNRDGSNQKSILQLPGNRAVNLLIRNGTVGAKRTTPDMLKVIEQGGFFPRWGPASKDAQYDRSVH